MFWHRNDTENMPINSVNLFQSLKLRILSSWKVFSISYKYSRNTLRNVSSLIKWEALLSISILNCTLITSSFHFRIELKSIQDRIEKLFEITLRNHNSSFNLLFLRSKRSWYSCTFFVSVGNLWSILALFSISSCS